MSGTSVEFKARDIIAAYESDDYNAVSRYVSVAANELKSYYRNKDYQALKKSHDKLDHCFLFPRKEEETNASIGYMIGYICGILQSLEEFLISDEFEINSSLLEEKSADIESVPHVHEILKVLSTTDEVQHQSLADRIGIDKSTLTPIMERLNKLNLVSFSRIGKFKFYSVTSVGRAYNQQFSVNENMIADASGKLEKILNLLMEEKEKKKRIEQTRNEIAHNCIDTIYIKHIKAKEYGSLINKNRNVSLFKTSELFFNSPISTDIYIHRIIKEQNRSQPEEKQGTSIDLPLVTL